MGRTFALGGAAIQRRPAGLPFVRLAQELGYAKPKTARDNLRRPYEQVAVTNRVLRDCGKSDLVADLMREIDASLGPLAVPPLELALHQAQLADMQEDLAEESFRDKLARGEATVEDAKKFIRDSARARFHAEQAERAAMEWIKQQEARS